MQLGMRSKRIPRSEMKANQQQFRNCKMRSEAIKTGRIFGLLK